MKDRIKQIMDAQQMSQQAFAAFLDISPATLSSIFNGRTKPTIPIIEAVKKKIPNINTDWLMFGSGSMFSDSKDQQSDATSPTPGAEEGMLDFGYDDNLVIGNEQINDAPRVQETYSVRNTPRETAKTEIKYVDKPQRHVVEIKVYYDDFTYESFYPAPKK
ncbi:MAG: helix-turn-helix domain-containing protein [Prevotella sp.]